MKYGIIIATAAALITTAAVMNMKKSSGSNSSGSKSAESMIAIPEGSGAFEPVAVIELFTSQGCSSCPSADRLLSNTITDADKKDKKIFALSFHVDYWNRLGWADPFSSAGFTQRQGAYVSSLNLDGAYTPQAIVNGTREFVGSDEGSLSGALSKALSTKAEVSFTKLAAINADGTIKVSYALDGNYNGSKINIALVSLSETTSVKRGENGGRTLKNENVVRQLITNPAAASGEVSFASSPVPAKGNMAIIAFVQEGDHPKIIGAAKAMMN